MPKNNGSGYVFRCSEQTTQLLGDIRRWMKVDTMGDALRCCIERMHMHASDMEHVRKPEERPLVKLGQGDYTREIREEDC